jgi:hypothetical protein
MDARITTTCPWCGSVPLDPDDVMLVVPDTGLGWYLFDCVGCGRQVVKDAPLAAVVALARAEIAIHPLPAEVTERLLDPPSPRLDADALLDAVLLLAGTDDLSALAAQPTR